MHAPLQIRARMLAGSTAKSNCLYTPTYTTASDREEEVESNDTDFSDYYSDSGYPARRRPRLVLLNSSPAALRQSTLPKSPKQTAPAKRNLPPAASSHSSRSRKVPVIATGSAAGAETTTRNKAFSKLRSLRNNRVIPVSSPDRQRPPSSLVTNSLCANGNASSHGNSSGQRPKQLRSLSLPEKSQGTSDLNNMAAQTKVKKSKKVGRALSFSLGTGDKKKRARTIFGNLGRGSGGDSQTKSEPPQVVTHSPVLVGRKAVRGGGGGTATIYEEDKASVSSAEETEDDRLGYLQGSKFGSCRELTSLGLDSSVESNSRSKLRPLSNSKHKRPSLPNFTKFLSGLRQDPPDHDPVLEEETPPQPPQEATTTPSPSQGTLRRRKLSDPGSAPSTPEPGNSPTSERRPGREESGGVARSRPLRKGFTFSVGGGANVSPDWKEMRHHVVRFLLETEQSYVQSLKTIMKVYLEPLKKPQAFGMIDSSLVRDIFYQIPELCGLHERFLHQISLRTERWHPLQKIGDVFVDTFSKCQLMNIYTLFIHNFMRAKAAIEIAKQARPVFAKFLERSKASTGKLSLDDLLIKPVQRIPRYLLFIKDLLKHTSASHPDHAPLRQALDELTGLAERVNESEREMARMEQQRELLNSVDGLALFVRPESELVRYDLVTEAQGSAHKRDRFLILFSDVLVCASTRRKSTGLRRSSLLNLSALNPDTFRYKIKWSTPLRNLSMGEVQAPMVERKKKNTLEKVIENLTRDEATLVQLLESSNTLRHPHQPLTSVLKDLLSEVRESLSLKRADLENLPLLHSRVDLMCYDSLPPTQYSIIFASQRLRNQWEEDFLRVKRSMCSPLLDPPSSSSSSSPPPALVASEEADFEFLHPLHVQSGRAGMKLSCAGVCLPAEASAPHKLWAMACDDYGGQVCLLDLQTNTRPLMVASYTISDSRILCITAVPQGGSPECRDTASHGETTSTEGDIWDAPSDNCTARNLDRGRDAVHPEVGVAYSKTALSMPRDMCGSLVTSFSSDSSSTTTTLSRSPSLTSTHSEPHDPSSDTPLPDNIVGVASDLLDSTHPTEFKGRGEATLSPRRKRNGFHRVCSNSAPDLLKVVSESSPTREEEGFRKVVGGRGATSLSPPPPVDSKIWSPVHPRPLAEGEGSSESRGTSMWVGTEGGQILVYPPGSNLRSRNNPIIHLPSAVHCIRYHKQRVFAGLANGTVAVFDPRDPLAGHTHLISVSSAPIVSCVSSGGRLLVASLSSLYHINTSTMEATPVLSLPDNQFIQCVECAGGEGGESVWVSVRDQPLLHHYHLPASSLPTSSLPTSSLPTSSHLTSSLLTSVDCSQKLKDILRGCSPLIRQSKTLSLRVTSLLVSHHHLLIGTSTGVTLTLPLPPHPSPEAHLTLPLPPHPSLEAHLSHLPQGHKDSVSFLCQLQCRDSVLVLSGGTGYENLTSSTDTHKITESASCLLLWRPSTQSDSNDH